MAYIREPSLRKGEHSCLLNSKSKKTITCYTCRKILRITDEYCNSFDVCTLMPKQELWLLTTKKQMLLIKWLRY